MGSRALARPLGDVLFISRCLRPFNILQRSYSSHSSEPRCTRHHAYRVNPNKRRGDEYGPVWPPMPSAATDDDEAPGTPLQGPSKPVKGSLCSGNWKLAFKEAHAIAETPSRFPYADRFEVEGQSVSSELVIEALSMQLMDERAGRFERVAQHRCYSIMPVVEGLVDRGNVGAICRSADGLLVEFLLCHNGCLTGIRVICCAATGFGAMHCIDTSSGRVKSSRANRTSKGAEKWLDVQEHKHGTAACVAYLKACGFRVLVTQLTPTSVPIHDIDFTQPTAFILGNEVNGASEEAITLADQAITVPMSPSFVESFNVSVAAALIMSEARRQRMAKFGCSGDLTPDEARILTAAMLLKQRGSRAVQWHPLWRDAFLQASSSAASLTAPAQQIRTPCNVV